MTVDELNTTWEDVILDRDTKDLLQQLVAPAQMDVDASSEIFLKQLRISGILLYGPPGTGKTHLSRAIASTSSHNMLAVDYARIQSWAAGESERLIRGAFSLASKLHPCVLFIDEVDCLFSQRSPTSLNWERARTAQFLQEMDGLSRNERAPILLAATNRPWALDEAFLRRLPHKVHIGLPDRDSRAAILRTLVKPEDLDPTVDLEGLAKVTPRYSGSDLKSICAEAALIWKTEQARLDSLWESVGPRFVSVSPRKMRLDVNHFARALELVARNDTKELNEQLEHFAARFNPRPQVAGRVGLTPFNSCPSRFVCVKLTLFSV